jgi:hypothetical protein
VTSDLWRDVAILDRVRPSGLETKKLVAGQRVEIDWRRGGDSNPR